MVSENCHEIYTTVIETFDYELPKIADGLIELKDLIFKDNVKKAKELAVKANKSYDRMEKSIDRLIKCECKNK